MSDTRLQDIMQLALSIYTSAAAGTMITQDDEFRGLAKMCLRAARDFYEVVDAAP